jgi:NAD(P)H-nitrite reductase large subunit
MNKKFVCRCLDLTEEDIIQAINEGYNDLETLKRHSGFSTGPCQGKSCIMHVIKILIKMKKIKLEDLNLTVMRPPIDPISINQLAGN